MSNSLWKNILNKTIEDMSEETELKPDLSVRGQWTSASNATADELCQGRHQAQLSIPEPPESEDAKFGTAIHKVLAGETGVALTTEQESIVDSMQGIDLKVLTTFYPNVAGKVDPPMRERRLWIEWADKLKHSGQIDVAHIIGYRGLIGEYKSLPGDVPTSPSNLQLRDQAVLLATNVPGLKEIGVYVNQPLVTHSPEICIYQVADLDRARDDLYRRVFQSNQRNAPRTAGEVQCKYCRAKPVCKEYQKFASSIVLAGENTVLSGVSVVDWTPAMRTMFMDRVSLAEKWLDECKEQLREMLTKDPNSVPGYTLKEGRNNPTIINPGAVFANFQAQGGTQEQFMQAVTIGKGKLAEALKEVTKLKGNKLESAVDVIIGKNVTVTKNRPSIIKKP